MHKLVFILLVTFGVLHAVSASEWIHHGVVNDVIDHPPTEKLDVYYSKSRQNVSLGNYLTPKQVRAQPVLKWNADKGVYYTVLMVDPDAPSRADPKMGQWRHWLVGNVQNNDIDNGDTLTAYVGAGPPQNTGYHRYVFLIYKQASKISFNEEIVPNTSAKTRPKFNAREFARKYNLGEPVAGNFFQAEYDDSVPELYKQLSS